MRVWDRYAARRLWLKTLTNEVLLVKVVPHKHNVGQCYRCGTTVEPLDIKQQWFVKMKPLAEPALKAVLDGNDKLYSRDGFSKTYYTLDGKRSAIGVSRVSFGGDIVFLRSIVEKCGEINRFKA